MGRAGGPSARRATKKKWQRHAPCPMPAPHARWRASTHAITPSSAPAHPHTRARTCSRKAARSSAASLAITSRSSCAVLHARTALMRSLLMLLRVHKFGWAMRARRPPGAVAREAVPRAGAASWKKHGRRANAFFRRLGEKAPPVFTPQRRTTTHRRRILIVAQGCARVGQAQVKKKWMGLHEKGRRRRARARSRVCAVSEHARLRLSPLFSSSKKKSDISPSASSSGPGTGHILSQYLPSTPQTAKCRKHLGSRPAAPWTWRR